MNIGRTTTAAAVIVLGSSLATSANAQNKNFMIPASLSYSSASQRDTWNTVLLISAGVMIIGLIQEESTLTILGGAGVIVSLIQTNKMNYRPSYTPRGLDLVKSGPLSFGVSPFGQIELAQRFNYVQPSVYLSASFKF